MTNISALTYGICIGAIAAGMFVMFYVLPPLKPVKYIQMPEGCVAYYGNGKAGVFYGTTCKELGDDR